MAAAPASDTLSAFVRPVEPLDCEIIATGFLGERAFFAGSDGRVLLDGDGDAGTIVSAHPDSGILVAASDGTSLLTGGDDGCVVRLRADGTREQVHQSGGAWIDAVALGPDGATAWACGRKACVRDKTGTLFTTELASTGRGLAFAPKGFQLAIARYNGASLWFPRTAAEPKDLPWKGSHIGVTWAPDGRFVVSTMQENALHGWRLADTAHMRMTGYPAKTRSLSWSPDGKWLATSGADAAIVWPFQTRDGPMGKPPLELSVRPARVEQVASHPAAPVLAIGYADGGILLTEFKSEMELLARAPDEDGAITALGWDKKGMRLSFGTRSGAGGVLALPAL